MNWIYPEGPGRRPWWLWYGTQWPFGIPCRHLAATLGSGVFILMCAWSYGRCRKIQILALSTSWQQAWPRIIANCKHMRPASPFALVPPATSEWVGLIVWHGRNLNGCGRAVHLNLGTIAYRSDIWQLCLCGSISQPAAQLEDAVYFLFSMLLLTTDWNYGSRGFQNCSSTCSFFADFLGHEAANRR